MEKSSVIVLTVGLQQSLAGAPKPPTLPELVKMIHARCEGYGIGSMRPDSAAKLLPSGDMLVSIDVQGLQPNMHENVVSQVRQVFDQHLVLLREVFVLG